MVEITMPRLSDSMEEGVVVSWLKGDGELVARGEEIVEIETDKATMPYEAQASGVLHHVVNEGESVRVGVVIAHLVDEGEPYVSGASTRDGSGPDRATNESPTQPRGADPTNDGGERAMTVSPVARRLARNLNVDLSSIRGTGPHGRILKSDVEAAAGTPADGPDSARSGVTPAPTDTAKGPVDRRELSRVQAVIARRMAEAKATVPHFVVEAEVDMSRSLALVADLRALRGDGSLSSPTVNDLVVKASALALRAHPKVNGAFLDGGFEAYGRVNVGIAVTAPDALLVPTVFDADTKSLDEVAVTTRYLAGRARDGELTPPELAGGTFTVSNLGMYGITGFEAVINPPQAAILAVGAAIERPVVRDGQIVVRPVMSLTLSCDHRIIYGAEAAAFLGAVRGALEQPTVLLL
jgi:pyruvate dehydrogenase E2 component (dihydrolipoamide acetyltransferase)